MSEVPNILTPEEMLAEKERKAAIAARFGGNIYNGGRKKSPATVIREMMEGEFASVTEKNMSQIASKLLEMVHGEDGNDRRFAIKTLIDANNKIVDRAIEENKEEKGGQLVVNVNRGSVTVSKGKESVKIDLSTSEDALRSINVFEQVKELEPVPEEFENLGSVAEDLFYNSEEVEDGLQEEEKSS